ncbi:MAG TPA: hypothetical protein ENJ93_06865 [Chloroflexi bacterium]|nr:hypothetical protein [Chloroflexota bacterium]
MQPRIKVGLIVGGAGLLLNVCVAALMGICGPFVALTAGAIAGFVTAGQEQLPTKNDGARAGAISGLVAGALVFVGQLIGGISVLLYLQTTGTPTLFGAPPNQFASGVEQTAYYAAGLGVGVCFGLAGLGMSALAGAFTGYLGTSSHTDTVQAG